MTEVDEYAQLWSQSDADVGTVRQLTNTLPREFFGSP